MKNQPSDMLYRACLEWGRMPLANLCLPADRGYFRRHYSPYPVSWCRRCAKIVIRDMGRWWE